MENRGRKLKVFLIVLGGFSAFSSEARVFRMKNETVAAYFGGSYSPSMLKQTHFSETSGLDASIDQSFLTNYGGEIGVLFTTKDIGLRLGVELIKPGSLTKAIGSDKGGQKLYDFESSISALIPKITVELNLKTADTWRVFLALGGGTATATYKNSYTFTSAGTAAYGIPDFSEEGIGSALLYDGALGFESLMNDTTTMALAVGYRKLEVPQYKYKLDVTSFSGTHLKNEVVLNDDDTVKSSLFSGPTAYLLFRFYLGK